jgi:hypothetical protein
LGFVDNSSAILYSISDGLHAAAPIDPGPFAAARGEGERGISEMPKRSRPALAVQRRAYGCLQSGSVR